METEFMTPFDEINKKLDDIILLLEIIRNDNLIKNAYEAGICDEDAYTGLLKSEIKLAIKS